MYQRLAIIMIFLVPLLAACQSAKPFDYAAYDKMPGLFSGEDGVWVVYSSGGEALATDSGKGAE